MKKNNKHPFIPTDAEIAKVDEWFEKAAKNFRRVVYKESAAGIEAVKLMTALMHEGYISYTYDAYDKNLKVLSRTEKWNELKEQRGLGVHV